MTATVYNANEETVDGVNVDFLLNDVIYDNGISENGMVNVSYICENTEDLNIKIKQENNELIKHFWYDTSTSDNNNYWFGGGSHEYTEDGLRIYGSSSEVQIIINHDFNFKPLEYSYTLSKYGNHTSAQKVTTRLGNSGNSNNYDASNSVWYGYENGHYYNRYSNNLKTTSAPIAGDRIKILCYNNKMQLYINDELISTTNYSGNYKNFGWYINNGRDFYVKDILVKEL